MDPLTTTQEVEELNADHSILVWHLKQIGKVKKLKYMPCELTENQNNSPFEVSSSLTKHFSVSTRLFGIGHWEGLKEVQAQA